MAWCVHTTFIHLAPLFLYSSSYFPLFIHPIANLLRLLFVFFSLSLRVWYHIDESVRALQGDLVPDSQQHAIQSASVVMSSLGDLSVNAVLQMFREPISEIRIIFASAAIFYIVTTSTLLFAGREAQVLADDPAIANSAPPSFNVLSYLRDLPSWMWRIGGTYALGFFTFYCVMPYASSWIGSSVLGGAFPSIFYDEYSFCFPIQTLL